MSAHSLDTAQFFDQLTEEVLALRVVVHQRFRLLSAAELNRRPSYDRWSVGQCLEHLNIVGGHYLPEIGARLRRAQARGSKPAARVRHGLIGPRLTAAMLRPATEKKLVTPELYAPTGTRLPRTVVETFTRQLDELLRLLLLARQVNANAVRVPNPLVPLLRLRLTDQFEFLVAHLQRHVLQAEQVLDGFVTKGEAPASAATAAA